MHRWGYTAVIKVGKSPATECCQHGFSMPRILILIVAQVLIVGGLILLSTQAREVPTTTIETDVSQGADAR
jgi:hypothetical protein